jgi:hypothetical protein
MLNFVIKISVADISKKKHKYEKKAVPLCAETNIPIYIYDRYFGLSREKGGLLHPWVQAELL